MLNNNTTKEYFDLRTHGLPSNHAWEGAKIRVKFDEFAALGFVVFEKRPWDEQVDLSHIDTWGLSSKKTKAAKEALIREADREGLWEYVVYVQCPCCEQMQQVSQVGEIFGDDVGYELSLKAGAIEEAQRRHL